MCIPNMWKEFVLNIYGRYFCEQIFYLFKVVGLIEVSLKLLQEKQQTSYFQYIVVLVVYVN